MAVVEVRWLDLDVDPSVLAPTLTDEELTRVMGFATEPLQRRAAARLSQRRMLLAAALEIEPTALEVHHEPSGQPFVLGDTGRVAVSASSRDDLGLLAWSTDVAVGVDVESLAEVDPDGSGLLERMAAPSEREALASLSGDELHRGMLRLWVRKEAYLKATGEGIGAGLRRAEVPLDEGVFDRPFDPVGHGSHWRLFQLDPPLDDFDAALVTTAPPDGDALEVRIGQA